MITTETISSATTTALRNPLVVPAGTGQFVELGDHRGYAKLTTRNSGAFLLSETEADPQGGVPPHIHTREDETFYILSGRFTFWVGDRTIEAETGDAIFAPRHIPHAWRCVSAEGGRMLILFTPGDNFEAFAFEMAQRGANPAADMADPATIAEFMALAERYGITMLPPK